MRGFHDGQAHLQGILKLHRTTHGTAATGSIVAEQHAAPRPQSQTDLLGCHLSYLFANAKKISKLIYGFIFTPVKSHLYVQYTGMDTAAQSRRLQCTVYIKTNCLHQPPCTLCCTESRKSGLELHEALT